MTSIQTTADSDQIDQGLVRVVVADDHDLYRRGVQLVLGLEPRISVVGEARDGAEAVAMVEQLAPDVVLMDVFMPQLSGIDACRAIKELAPTTKVLILTMSDEEKDLFGAIKSGASGYLIKNVAGEEVSAAVLAVHEGRSLIPPTMAAQLLTEFAELSRRSDLPAIARPRLTDRELEVLRLVAHGRSNKDIAATLFISENTVKNHVRNILEKLQLHSRIEAAMYAVREKLISDQ